MDKILVTVKAFFNEMNGQNLVEILEAVLEVIFTFIKKEEEIHA